MQAIETRYRGYRFRSRLEARWAIFFDVMGEQWEYEKEGYRLRGDKLYLPDFWLPRFNCFVEIKGAPPMKDEAVKAELLRDASQSAVMLFHGAPLEHWGILYCWDLGESSGGSSDFEAQWSDRDYGDLNFCVVDSKSDRAYFMGEYTHGWNPDLNYPYLGKTAVAAEAAKSARFEHGEVRDYREPRNPAHQNSDNNLPF